ncbi:MAG TPA: Fe2+-dependent dioxygenase [Phenylobacterium sp.]|uniref:Fe2+-dependent dioxygenase n=1 Tax=Phenylobacterium sp. TaxID=1871053 RepID=UPI002BA8CC1E|nr:Fe2+-dependent dioxygenase [Phenylobacterium sp.]HSV04075.1 Fe2+-dependent dioxygenase [Phenylobacterium sp.]
MFLEIDDVLTPEEVGELRALAAKARFVDGRISSPHSAVKDNLQIAHEDEAYQASSRLMAQALQRNEPFRNFAFPSLMAPPLLARYEPGMKYGLHSDAAVMQLGARQLRSDLSCTVFLSEPEAYQGGALSIRLGARAVEFKLKPGAAVLYPSTTLHEVRPVTKGERLVGITFIESQIADNVLRELLYDLDEVAALEGLTMADENRVRLQHVRANLRRMWSSSK